MKKVLIFDDDSGILEVTKIILQDKGYQVKTLLNFDNILENINLFKPDIILVDLLMPDTNGEEIVKQIKSHPDQKNIPLIVLSANKNTKEIASHVGADDYLSKPFNITDLESIVDKYIN